MLIIIEMRIQSININELIAAREPIMLATADIIAATSHKLTASWVVRLLQL